MERLNEIFDRSGRYQQPLSEQRARARTSQPEDPAARRTTADHTPRTKSKYYQNTSSQSYQQNSSLSSRARNYQRYRSDEEAGGTNPDHRTYIEPVSHADQSTYTPAP